MKNISLSEKVKPISKTKNEIVALLDRFQISREPWGSGNTQTLDHLLVEIEKGETELFVTGSNKLVRKVCIIYVDILYRCWDGPLLKLIEERQEFADGRVRVRKLDGSIAEKLQFGESPEIGTVERAVMEELGIEPPLDIAFERSWIADEDSPSYPGLPMEALCQLFSVILTDSQFKSEGYIESQADKRTFFTWTVAGELI